MTEKELIEKAATEYSIKKWVKGQRAVCKDGFKAGASWWALRQQRLKEIKKDLIKLDGKKARNKDNI